MKAIPALLLASAALLAAPLHAFPVGHALYTQPAYAPFIEHPGEQVTYVTDSSGSIAQVQSSMASAQSANPGAILVIQLSGTYTVQDSPLILGSNECLLLEPGTVIQAAANIKAGSLIQIVGQSDVSVAGGTLDARGRPINCIDAEGDNRVNLDHVVARNAGLDCILLAGNGSGSQDNELTITRCACQGAGHAGYAENGGTVPPSAHAGPHAGHYGIVLQGATQAVVMDNTCSGNSGGGIRISDCAHSTFENNTVDGNGADGIHVDSGSSNAISDNQIDGNPVGIELTAGSSGNIVASNAVTGATTAGIDAAGMNDLVFENAFQSNAADFTVEGSGNYVVAYRTPLAAPGQNYFYPPLADNPHSDPTIVNGLGRYDLTIGDDTLDDVQAQYDQAVANHPTSVIVLHLMGNYTTGSAPLTLGSNTCVLLSGTIQRIAGSTLPIIVQGAAGSTNISFSGGAIDGGDTTSHNKIGAMDFTDCGLVWVSQTTLRDFGKYQSSYNTKNTGNDGVLIFHSANGPELASNVTIDTSAQRGIWTEQTGPFVITDCTSRHNEMDGVDCDYRTSLALVKLNDLSSNARYGLFFEQGATYDVGIANDCSSGLRGVNIYDNALNYGTDYNTAIANLCLYNSTTGLRTGAAGTRSGTPATTDHSFLFNNIAMYDAVGIQSEGLGIQNYWSQNVLGTNRTDVETAGAPTDAFFNPPEP